MDLKHFLLPEMHFKANLLISHYDPPPPNSTMFFFIKGAGWVGLDPQWKIPLFCFL